MSVRKSVAWSLSGQFAIFVVTFGGSIIVARLLSPMDMGIYAVALAAISIMAILSSLSVGLYIVREAVLDPEMMDSAFTINALFAVALAGAMYGISFAAAWFLDEAGVGEILRALAVTPLIGILEFHPSVMLQREMQFKRLALVNTARALITVAATVGFAFQGYAFMSMAYAGLISSVFGAVAYNLVGRRYFRFCFTLTHWRPLMTFGLRMLSIGGVASIATRVSDIILGRLLGLAALGLYTRASSVSNMIWDNVYGGATRVLFVKLSRDFNERGVLRDTFLRSIELMTAVMWPLLIGLAVLARPVVVLLYGDKWLDAALPLSLLLIAQFVYLTISMNWELFVLRGETARQTRFEFLRAGVGIVTFSIGCLFSITAAATARIVDAVFAVVLYKPHMNRLADARPGETTQIYAQSLILTVAATLPSLLLMIYIDWSPRAPLSWIICAVITGVAGWLGTLLKLKHPLIAEFRLVANQLNMGKSTS